MRRKLFSKEKESDKQNNITVTRLLIYIDVFTKPIKIIDYSVISWNELVKKN